MSETKQINIHPYPAFEMYVENDFVVKGFESGWESQTLREWGRYLFHFNQNDTAYQVLDIGAYTGIYSLFAANYGWKAHVHAFEPHPDVSRRLGDNASLLLSNIHLYRPLNTLSCHYFALGSETGTANFEITGGSVLPSGSSLAAHPDKAPLKTVTVDVKKLNDVDLTYGAPVKLVKIDVERHELAVLQGMTYCLQWSKPVLFIELLTPEDFIAVRDFLSKYDYGNRVTQIDDNPMYSVPSNKELTRDDIPVITEYTTNFIFTRN